MLYLNYDISVYHVSINYTIYPPTIQYIIYIYIHFTIYPINVGKTITFFPQITIFIGGIFTIPSHGWFMTLF